MQTSRHMGKELVNPRVSMVVFNGLRVAQTQNPRPRADGTSSSF